MCLIPSLTSQLPFERDFEKPKSPLAVALPLSLSGFRFSNEVSASQSTWLSSAPRRNKTSIARLCEGCASLGPQWFVHLNFTKMSDKELSPEAGGGASGKFQFLQPSRDPQSNWEVDLAKNLEEYLLKVCSGEVSSEQSVNFAEAALLLQGSVQVYSRKVEYLYSLVLHILEFLSQKSQDQQEKVSVAPDDSAPAIAIHGEDEVFLGLDDVPVDPKNSRDNGLDKHEISYNFVKAPANLLVLEGDCLDTGGDANEFESYLLANTGFYGDFLLLDPCDAGEIDNFLKNGNAFDKELEQASAKRGTSGRPKTRESSLQTPVRRSAGSFRPSTGKEHAYEMSSGNLCSKPQADQSYSEKDFCSLKESNFGYADVDESDEDEDPWKPLNPHEAGNLKIKPFRKGRKLGCQTNSKSNRKGRTTKFPLAKMDGIISSELAESYEVKVRLKETKDTSQCLPLYEKLRGSLSFGSHLPFDDFGDNDQEARDENDLPDFGHSDCDMGMEVHTNNEKLGMDGAKEPGGAGPSSLDDLCCSASLEDLCRSHLDALLATIAETEKQTELAARVSTWKQKIERAIEEQEEHSAFDIHHYGERILDKLSLEGSHTGGMPFTDVVAGQPKYEVARTFSALLQLVNNGSVDLQRPSNGEPVCYTAKNPFHVKLLHAKRRKVQVHVSSLKKRMPSPSLKSSDSTSPLRRSPGNGKVSSKLKKAGLSRHTPDGKRRRRSGRIEHLHSATDV
ncbi:hypothetical protein HPP92_012032 [Vanilla planifolia]|uniref:Condensin-2 complex subunit H2 n=1 Tax=Vanilla planifolia TaxID=51239 RepID=A0A835RCK2_VANPL|nr:hypothetical protein HPP92_012032 [Vanilla planifolia]